MNHPLDGPRHAAAPPPPSARPARTYAGVALLDGGAPCTPVSTGLELVLDGDAVRLVRPDGGTLRSVPWEEVSALVTADPSWVPDLGRGVAVDFVTSGGPAVRVFVPSRRPGAVAAKMRAVARRRSIDPDTPDRRAPVLVAGALVAASGALVTWLLLAAGHVVHP